MNVHGFTFAAQITPGIDWSWVPAGLPQLVAGILGLVEVASIGAFVVSCVLYIWTKLTYTRIDNPRGVEALIAVMAGSAAVGSLGALVSWGIGITPATPIGF